MSTSNTSRHIFLSYSRKDNGVMQRLKSDLVKSGLAVWTDEGIEPGTTSWKRAIEDAILDAEALVGILSPDAADSNWVRAELDFAELHGIRIFLLLARGDMRSAVPFGFVSSQWIDIRDSYSSGFERLLKAIQRQPVGDITSNTPQPRQTSVTLEDIKTERLMRPDYITVAAMPDLSEILPSPFEWVKIPAGPVTLDDASTRGGTTGGLYLIPEFAIAKYPITNAQFQVFVDAPDGYQNPVWWNFSDHARQWRSQHPKPEPTAFAGDDYPRTDLSWYDAVGFCRWLSSCANLKPEVRITLPTEHQWQRAAQGDDRREFPWGNIFDPTRCNSEESEIKQTTPVTRYQNGASRFEVLDMAGNLWEWCLTKWGTDSESLVGETARVVRGGSYASNQVHARCATRMQGLPFRRYFLRGMRLVSYTLVPTPTTGKN